MTISKRLRFGERPQIRDLTTSTGTLSTSVVPVAVPASPPIQVARHARNGKHPNAVLESMKSEAINSVGLFKTKEVFRSFGYYGALQSHGMTAGSGTCNRWRFAFHTGPYTQWVQADVLISVDSGFGASTAFGQLDLTELGTANVVTDTFPTGASALGTVKLVTKMLFVKPDTTYTAVFSDHNSVMCCANVHEITSLTSYLGGHLPQNLVAGGPILDAYRQNAAEVIRALWQKSAWPLFNWCVEDDTLQPTTTSQTFTNLVGAFVDQVTAVTTLGSSNIDVTTPGFIFNTIGRARRSQLVASSSGIPVVLAVYGSCSTSFSSFVRVVDPNGRTIANMDDGLTSTPGWTFSSGFLPGNMPDTKYDVQFTTEPTTTTKVGAVCLYELG